MPHLPRRQSSYPGMWPPVTPLFDGSGLVYNSHAFDRGASWASPSIQLPFGVDVRDLGFGVEQRFSTAWKAGFQCGFSR